MTPTRRGSLGAAAAATASLVRRLAAALRGGPATAHAAPPTTSSGIAGEVVPIIRDRYVVHHQNLGGAGVVYLENPDEVDEAFALLSEVSGVEEIYRRTEAAEIFDLYADRIGDIFILGEEKVVFGDLGGPVRYAVDIRSHGSRHEATVPIVSYGGGADAGRYGRSIDLTRNFDWEL